MKKSELRKLILNEMKLLNKNQKTKADQYLAQKLYQSEVFKNAQKIGIVLSMAHEVNTFPIIETILSENKTPYVPFTDYSSKEMTFQKLEDFEQLSTDEKGIQFVNANTEKTNDLDLIIVPGVAFKTEGYRVGYGGGYFDKFLNQNPTRTISLVYDVQLNNDFNVEPHDEKVEQIIIANTD